MPQNTSELLNFIWGGFKARFVLPEMKPFELNLKFSFHLRWDPDHFHENPEVVEMTEAGELEFF